MSNLVLHTIYPSSLTNRISPYIFVVNSPINIINLSCTLPNRLEILTFYSIHFFNFFIIFTSSDAPTRKRGPQKVYQNNAQRMKVLRTEGSFEARKARLSQQLRYNRTHLECQNANERTARLKHQAERQSEIARELVNGLPASNVSWITHLLGMKMKIIQDVFPASTIIEINRPNLEVILMINFITMLALHLRRKSMIVLSRNTPLVQ